MRRDEDQTPQLIGRYKMEANFEGLVRLLATNLYAEPDVFVRELIQNAHDSIVRRRSLQPDFQGAIQVDLDSSARTLVFRDNGLGMDEADVTQFLSVIGSTGTGDARTELEAIGKEEARDLIGQFGIGLLSAFVVADRVVVRTRKEGEPHGLAWHNQGSADYELYRDETFTAVGTEVTVEVGETHTYILDPRRIREAILTYCDFLPVPIALNGEGPVNLMDAPWHKSHYASAAEEEREYREFVNRRYPDIPLDVIPVSFSSPVRAHGVLYISDRHVPDINSTGVVDVFVRRMFVLGDDRQFLPPWAKFVRGVIDSPDLRPTGARDNIHRDDPAFTTLRDQLGDLIVTRLRHLAAHEPKKFRQINAWHHYHLKGMAVTYAEFFDDVVELLLFETNAGPLSLEEYLAHNARYADRDGRTPIYYFAYRDSAAQFYRLAESRRWAVINAGAIFEEALLKKYARAHPAAVRLERLDATDDPEIFEPLDPGEEALFRQLEVELEGHLHRQGVPTVVVRTRRFDPNDLPAVVILTPESEAEERLRNMVSQPWFMADLEEVATEALEAARRKPLNLFLNAGSPLVQSLARTDIPRPTRDEAFLAIYNSAALYAHSLLTKESADAIHGQYVRMIASMLDQQQELQRTGELLESNRREMRTLREQHGAAGATEPRHVVLFMITPFRDEYGLLEQAVRRVFEREPFFFEVALARDYRHEPELLKNVQAHIMRADGFLAEISELNPNVMLELGAVLILDRTRPVFSLRNSQAAEDVPSDLSAELYVPYGGLGDPPEVLESAIRERFVKDGRPRDAGMRALLDKREKLYLSRTLLQDLPVHLGEEALARILGRYSTIDDLLAAPTEDLAAHAGVRPELLSATQAIIRDLADAAQARHAEQ